MSNKPEESQKAQDFQKEVEKFNSDKEHKEDELDLQKVLKPEKLDI